MFSFNSPALILSGLALVFVVIAVVVLKKKGASRSNTTSTDGLVSEQLYIGNLSYRIREGQLRSFFEKFGSIQNVRIIKHHHNGRSKGFGFVTFSTSDDAQQALCTNGEMFCGRPLVVRVAKAR